MPMIRDQMLGGDEGRVFLRTWSQDGKIPGGGIPILLFHDSLGCVALWRDFPEALARVTGRPVLAYDRLGFGRSDAHPGRLGLDFIAREAEQAVMPLLDRLGVSRFIACGHSVGGGMAVETAARLPEACVAVVTMGAQACVDDRILAGIRTAKAEFANPEIFARLAKYHGGKARWVLDAWTETWSAPGFADWSLDAALARLSCPVLAIHGALDEYGSTEHARRIAGQRGTAEILQGVGHVPYREDAARVLASVGRFLAPL